MNKDRPVKEGWSHEARSLFKSFEIAGRDQGWWDHEGQIVAAVSGGIDSMALLWLLCFRWRGKVIAAHLEHGFRKETALRDAVFVEGICREWNIECHIEHRDIPSLKGRGETLEEAGRRERYAFLDRVASSRGASFIATGHNADDQAETVFLNLLRGTGIRGLRGIPRTRERIVRPVIDLSREQLQGLLLEIPVPWVEDETNLETRYFRNKIRHVIFPLLSTEGNRRFADHLISLSSEAYEIESSREELSKSLACWCRRHQPLALRSWDTGLLRRMDDQTLQSIMAYEGRDLGLAPLSRSKTSRLLELIRRGEGRWRFQWERDLEVCGSRRSVSLVERSLFSSPGPCGESFPLKGERGSFSWGAWYFEWNISQGGCPFLGERACRVPVNGVDVIEVEVAGSAGEPGTSRAGIPWWAEGVWPEVRTSGTVWVPFSCPLCPARRQSSVNVGPSLELRARIGGSGLKGEIQDGI